MHTGARARVKAVINDPNASACGRQLDVWWTWEGLLYEARTCHWERIDVGVGDMLPDWKIAGWMGASGQAQGVHQHYVLTVGGVVVDPEPYLLDITADNPAGDTGTSHAQDDGTKEETLKSIKDSLDRAWALLSVLQTHPEATPEIVALAEQVKQEVVVEIKIAVGLQ